MADLKIVADYSDIQVMRRELVGVAKDAKASASVFETAYKKVEAQQKRSLNAVKQQLALSKRMEAQKAREAKVASASAAEVAKEEERLKNKFVEGYTAMNIYTKEMNDLAVARKKDIITADEQKAAVAELNAQMKAGTGAFANAATGMQIVGKRANRTGVLAQQAGYQFGDFAVQVQSGTNWLVAFGQQATQLIGTFSMLAKTTKAIMAFSALGVIVPVVTAIAGALMRTRDSAKEAEEETASLSDTISQLNSVQKTTADGFEQGLNAAFESSATSVGKLLTALREAKFAAAMEPLKDALDDITVGVDRVGVALDTMVAFDKIEKNGGTLSSVQESMLKDAKKLVVENLVLASSYDKVKASLDAIGESKTSKELVVNFAEALDSAEKLGGPVGQELVQSLIDAAKEAGVYDEILAQAGAKIDDSASSAKTLAAALREAASAMSSLAGFSDNLDKKLAVSVAKVQALKKGADAAVAGSIAAMRADLNQKISAAKSSGVDSGIVERMYGGLRGRISDYETSETERKRLEKANQSSGGSSGTSKKSPAQELQEYLDKLQQQADLEGKLVGLSGQKRTVEEAVIKARQKYGKETVDAQEAELRGALNLIEVEKERQRVFEEAQQQREQLVSSTESTLEDGFMSMVDGTESVKDAFRDMARDIIKELYRVLVVKKMVASVSKFFGFADGGAFSGGSQIQAYANGGVVGGPTFFPMAGGKTGLMGEAGPEAIMPLKRGANGKLGVQADGASQGNVVVNQSFNFQANGDDSVKKLIAQAAPQIANMTQKQIMDSRRRGGSMKAAFG